MQDGYVRSKHILSTKWLVLALVFLASCSKLSNQVEGTFRKSRDFARSQIISNGPMVADGTSSLLVLIQLMNSDGTPVTLFQPEYQIVSGGGVTTAPCTTSNINGVSTCVLKSVQAGTKRIAVTNITINLEADLTFTNPPAGRPIFGLASANRKQTSGGYSLAATIGNQEPGIKKTSGNYTLFGGVQGEAFSQ